jgi:hypothetical protein
LIFIAVWTEVKAEDCSQVLRQTNLITNESMNYSTMNTNGVKSQIEINKEIIQHYFEGYNVRNEAIFDGIIAPDYRDMVNRLIWTSGTAIAGAKNGYRKKGVSSIIEW